MVIDGRAGVLGVVSDAVADAGCWAGGSSATITPVIPYKMIGGYWRRQIGGLSRSRIEIKRPLRGANYYGRRGKQSAIQGVVSRDFVRRWRRQWEGWPLPGKGLAGRFGVLISAHWGWRLESLNSPSVTTRERAAEGNDVRCCGDARQPKGA